MPIRFVWTFESRERIARHGVGEAEVEAILLGRRKYTRKRGSRFTVVGKTSGRILFIVVESSKQEREALEVVTARVATPGEKHLFKRRGKGIQ